MTDEHVYFLFVIMSAFRLLYIESMDYFLPHKVISSPRGTINVGHTLSIHFLLVFG